MTADMERVRFLYFNAVVFAERLRQSEDNLKSEIQTQSLEVK